MCTLLLPTGVNPIAVNKYVYLYLSKNESRPSMLFSEVKVKVKLPHYRPAVAQRVPGS